VGSTRNCQAPPMIGTGLRDGESEKPQTSVHIPLYKGASDRGPLPIDVAARRHLLYQSNHKTQVIWKGRGDLLCYNPTFSLLHASRGHVLRPCAYSANSKVGENYYAQ
jgi:hypothetical protein